MRLLTNEQITKIHNRSLDMLEKIGVKVFSEKAEVVFKANGCEIKNQRVHIPGTLMQDLLSHRQSDIILHSRSESTLNISKDGPFLHNGGYCADIIDIRNGICRRATKKDAADLVRLIDKLDNVDMIIMPVYPCDVDDRDSILYSAKAMFENTDKPAVSAGVRNLGELECLYRMYSVLAGGEEELRSKPMFEVGICPLSPMAIFEDDCDMLMFAAEKGIPISANAAPIAGLTAPITLLGSLTQQNAECLAVVALARLIDPVSKMIFATRLNCANLNTTTVYGGSPNSAIMSGCAAQLANYYGFVSNVYGLGATSAVDSAQLGFEKSLRAIYPMIAGADVLSGCGTLADMSSISYEMMAIDDEIFSMCKHFFGEVKDDEDDLGFEAVQNVINGSSFILEENTLEYLRSSEIWNYNNSLSVNTNYASWSIDKKSILDNAEEKVRNILASHTPNPLSKEHSNEINKIYMKWKKSREDS